MRNEEDVIETTNDDSFAIDPKRVALAALHFWWVFAITIVVGMVAVTIYHRYKTPVYSSTISIIIDDENARTPVKDQAIMTGFMLNPGLQNMENQLAILRSWTMVRKAIQRLDFYISYYNQGRFKATETYRPSVHVVMDSTHVQMLNMPISIDIKDSTSYVLSFSTSDPVRTHVYSTGVDSVMFDDGEEHKYSKRHKFGEPVVMPWGAFSVVNPKNQTEGEMLFVFRHPEQVVASYQNLLNVSMNPKSNSTIATLTINGTNSQKLNQFLNTLVETYIADNLNQKNQIASNTIRFIEDQLGFISDSLRLAGSQLSDFRTQHGLQQTVSSKGEALFKEVQDYEAQIRTLDVYLNYYHYLEQYFSNDSVLSGVIAPAMFDTKSPVISTQLNQIMSINSDRMSYQDTYGSASNPASSEIMSRLQIAKNTLMQSVSSHIRMVCDNRADLMAKVDECNERLFALPETERELLGIERKYNLNNEVYNFLLRRRSESQIQKASNTADHKIIDPAMTIGIISPQKGRDRMIVLVLAIALPLGLIVLQQWLDTKVRTSDDVKSTGCPILCEVTQNDKLTSRVVLEHPKSLIAEAYRRLRSRLAFMVRDVKTPVIVVSSTMAGEGKTFSAFNIASIYAFSGKKTVLIGMDMRRPGMSKIVDIEKSEGLSSYLAGSCALADITEQHGDNLFIVHAGIIPPNPAELIMSDRCKTLFDELRQTYDVIIVDTPPMGIVSDAYMVARVADVLVFVVRQDYTDRTMMKETLASLKAEGIERVGLLFNDVKKSSMGYGKYGRYGKYGYGKYYGRHYGYYERSGYYTD